MDRRAFLKLNLHGMMLAATAPTLLALPDAASAATPDVCIAKGSPAEATRAAINGLGGMGRFVKAGQRVLIKPNMSFAQGVESATTTHPEVVRALVVMCKEAGASWIRVLDNSLQDAELSLQRSGIRDACNSVQDGICFHLMSESFYQEASIVGAKQMMRNAFMKDALAADVIISAPVAKSHSSTGVSLCLKGQMGLILDRRSMHWKYDLAESIVDLNLKMKPALSVIDATRVLSTGGPGGPGTILTPGEVIASADPVAADATAVASYEWYGRKVQPRQVKYIRLAHERGLGRMDIENLTTQRVTA